MLRRRPLSFSGQLLNSSIYNYSGVEAFTVTRYSSGWEFNWLKFSLEKPLEFRLEFWLEFPLDSTEEKGPF